MSNTTPPDVETRGPAIVATAIAFPILAAVFVGARVYTRIRIINFFGIDDWCCILTLIVSIAYSVCLSIWTNHGGGMHMYDMTEPIEEEYYKWILIASEFYALGLLGYKTAILLLYIRLFSVNKKFKRACYTVMAFNAAYLLSNIILQIFSCTPVEKYYLKNLPGHCVSLIPPDIAWGAMSMASDFAIALLPIPVIWRLKLTRREKILVSLVFLSGLIAFLMALIRWIIATIDLTTEDRTWVAGLAFLFSIIEVNTGIICGCTATLKPLVRFAREHTSRRRSSTGLKYEKRHRKHHHHRHGHGGGGQGAVSSSDEDNQKLEPLRAPPGTLNAFTATEKSVHCEDSPAISPRDGMSPLSAVTTARPSLVENSQSQFSHDLLNLPREGTLEQPALRSQREEEERGRDVYEMV